MNVKHLDQNMVENKKDKKNKTFINCLITHLMRCGKKNWAYLTVMQTGALIGQHGSKSSAEIYSDVFKKVRPFVEIRKVRVRRTTYMVPFPTNPQRQKHLVSAWLLETLRKDKRKISFAEKLKEELIKILLNKGETLEKKKDIYRKAEKSRSFMHFRWY